jgi:hypothetical protein
MYSLYRSYYSSRKITMLRKSDFTGTVRIRTPGLYVVAEDIVFNPDPHYLTTNEDYTSHPMFSMGYFAAITVECPGVIIDLQGHSIRQSYHHYCEQRFFTIIELARSAFIEGQGPGSVRSSDAEAEHVASDCMVLNGTLGLSSHSSIHGNNNTGIVLQNLRLRDFEVVGVQLNGVKNALIDRVCMQGGSSIPLASEVFSLLMHEKELAANPELYQDSSGEPLPVAVQLSEMVSRLRAPFTTADQAAVQDKDIQVPNRLKDIHAQLKIIAEADAADAEPLGLARFVSNTGIADGSAIYGLLLNSTGVAVNRLVEACAAGGSACGCPVASEYRTSCHRTSSDVSLSHVTIRGLRLQSEEHVVLRRGAVGEADKIVRDFTGATVRLPLLGAASASQAFDYGRAVVGAHKGSFDDLTASYLRDEINLDQLIADGTRTTSFAYNADVMAHVSKGIVGIRAESTHRLCIEHCHALDMDNTSVPHHPTEYAPDTASFVSLTDGSPDTSTARVFAGSDVRAVFLGNCTHVYVYKAESSRLNSKSGIVRGFEFAKTVNAKVHSTHSSDVSGRHICGTMVQNDCRNFTIQNSLAVRLVMTALQQDAAWSATLTPEEQLVQLKRLTRYAPTLDPRAFVCEEVSILRNVQF